MKILLLMVSFLILNPLFAKEKMVTLQSSIDGKYYDLKIDKMNIDVKIVGNIAETTLDITFLNKYNKRIEGTLYLPMKENATIFNYQFEMGKVMKTGVVVEKEKARVAYESTVRQKIDPALLIWTKGNNFKTRIWPIEAKSTKRIIISYQEILKPNSKKELPYKFEYFFPILLKYKLSSFKLNIKVENGKAISLMKDKNRFITDKKGNLLFIDENYKPNENIKIGVIDKSKISISCSPNKDIEGITAFIEATSYDKTRQEHYFSALTFPQKIVQKKEKPKSLCVFWDSSSSMEDRDLKKEIELLKKYKNYLGDTTLSFLRFNNEVISHKAESLSLDTIISEINNIIYDGGTQLGIIDTTSTPNDCKEALIFTDGVSNFGKKLPNLTIPTYFINSKLTAEHNLMKFLSNKTGASYINLQNSSIEEALASLENSKFSFISAEFNKDDVKEIYPNTPVAIKDNFTITGIVKKDTKIKLNFGISGKILSVIRLSIGTNENRKNDTVRRAFGKHKIDQLFKLKDENRAEIIRVSKKYSLLTEFTSFLVLESLNDYLKYSIVPPKELQKEYFKIIENRKNTKKKTTQQHLDDVLRKYQNMTNWWNQKHKTEEDMKIKVVRTISDKKMALEVTEEVEQNIGASGSGSGGGGVARNKRSVRNARPRVVRKMEKSLSDEVVKKEQKAVTKTFSAKIELKSFDPNTPYLKKLRALKSDFYKEYLNLKKDYKKSSSFYLDVSDFFFKKGDKRKALTILSNIAELELSNHELLRMLAYRLWQLKENQLALYTLNDVLEMRPEEPQSYRDIALTYRNMKKYQEAIDMFYKVVSKSWDSRFSDIDLISLYEMNAIIGRVGESKLNLTKIDKRLIKNLPVDIRVVLSWDADNTDIDLWVTDPYGEKCYYGNKNTKIGGYNSNDFTGGYGPEMFFLKNSHKGKYKIQANYYGSSSQKLSGEITIHAELFLNYGRKNQTKQDIVVRVKSKQQVVDLGDFNVDPQSMLNNKNIKDVKEKELNKESSSKLKNTKERSLSKNLKDKNKDVKVKDEIKDKSNLKDVKNCSYTNSNQGNFFFIIFLLVLFFSKRIYKKFLNVKSLK